MDKPHEAGLSLHKRIATGDPSPFPKGDFGVMHLSATAVGTGDPGGKVCHNYLPDSHRSAPHKGNQGNPDHGPHTYGTTG